jgi:hypothetical protein
VLPDCSDHIPVAAVPVAADDLDDFLNAAIRQRNIPGIAIAVVKDGVLVRSGGYGLADRERSVAPWIPDASRQCQDKAAPRVEVNRTGAMTVQRAIGNVQRFPFADAAAHCA